MKKVALVTGASGQDSLLLSDYLIKEHNYVVYAMARRAARPQSRHVKELLTKYPYNYNLISGDITDISSIIEAITLYKPDEFYNLAAQSHVGLSFKEPLSTVNITGLGAINCMEAIRRIKPDTRFYQASSSEMFGGTKPQFTIGTFVRGLDLDTSSIPLAMIDEETPFCPRSPYACAKTFAHNYAVNMREAYNLHFSCGILFNHESELRKVDFVTRKVTTYVAALNWLQLNGVTQKIKPLELGTLDFARDWGDAKDYVRAMHIMLQQDEPDDYVIATGRVKTGKQLLETAFGYINQDWADYVSLNPDYSRPTDVKVLVGNSSKAEAVLDWRPKREFEQLIQDMIDNDTRLMSESLEIIE